MNQYAHITGWGMAVPRRVVTNHDLARIVDTSDEWIRTRTGIRQRHIAGPDETTASLGAEAASRALNLAGLDPERVDLIVVATSSPEHLLPSTACLIQDRIGAVNACAFDLLAACTGFIFALNLADQAIRSGSVETVLVIGSETLSRLVNWKDRSTCVLFGDGAGAFVLQAREQPGGVLAAWMRSDGSGGNLISIPAGGSWMPTGIHTVRDGLHCIHMNGKEVYRFATRVMVQAITQSVEAAGLLQSDIHRIIPHQANRRIIEAVARKMELPIDRFVISLDRFGNTSTASIPIATCEAFAGGSLCPGDTVVFVGFGAGLSWGAAVVEWSSAHLPTASPSPVPVAAAGS